LGERRSPGTVAGKKRAGNCPPFKGLVIEVAKKKETISMTLLLARSSPSTPSSLGNEKEKKKPPGASRQTKKGES